MPNFSIFSEIMFSVLHRRFTSPAAKTINADICIVGGGIIGTLLASALAQSPYSQSKKIMLIEAGDLFQDCEIKEDFYSNRVSSITPTSADFFKQLGVWDKVKRKRDYPDMQVWDARSTGSIDFNTCNRIATIVENRLIQHALAESIKNSSVQVLNKTRVEGIEYSSKEKPVVHLDRGMQVQCELLVGADGPMSKVRTFAGIKSSGWDYNQNGLVATVELTDSLNNITAWQRFLPRGPLAMLPLSDTHSSIVWTLDSKTASLVCKLAPSEFVTLLNAALNNPYQDIEYLLNNITGDGKAKVDFKNESEWGNTRYNISSPHQPPTVLSVQKDSRACFPLRLRHADKYNGQRIVLVG